MNTNTEFASANYTAGQLNAVIKLIRKQAGEDGPERFLRGELVVSELPKCWTEKDGVIYFTLPPTEGLTGSQWVTRLERKGFKLSKWAKDVLNSKDFVPTTGVVNNIAVLKGELFSDDDRITSKIVAEGDRRLWKHGKDISPEIACQIREMFTDEEIEAMGLIWITTMHEPINDSDGDPDLLGTDRYDDGQGLLAYCDRLGNGWYREDGFAFVVPQVSPQS